MRVTVDPFTGMPVIERKPEVRVYSQSGAIIQQGGGGGGTTYNFVDREIPTGATDGVNTTFTLAHTPTVGSEHVYLNGLFQDPGAGNDYTISGATITYLTAPTSADKLRVSYRY